ncbi:magnesium chelatase subunit ChlI family protein [Phaeocystidibacter marisrubri]|uniref:magnesium chelatase subunit ChlI family protein n=1 Tax=Phaeocystidibacter marisrubri TaxID=1577780 RepID=UPI00389B3049
MKFEEISKDDPAESSEAIRQRVLQARRIQLERFAETSHVHNNAQMGSKQLRSVCKLNAEGRQMLEVAMERMSLSARAYDRILKVARTIADLDQAVDVSLAHLGEAIQYRSLDRGDWGE